MKNCVITRYTPARRDEWDAFVRKAKNGSFLFCRDYMDYHRDRFEDCSLMIEDPETGKLLAIFPATIKGEELSSHNGLTYGGLVMSPESYGDEPLEWLPRIVEWCAANGIAEIIYKPVPHIYHRLPAEEDLYALWRCGAQLSVRNLSTAIDLQQPLTSSRLGKRALKRARRFGTTVEQVEDASHFWDIIVEDRRVRHNTRPVHTGAEMQLLRDFFPEEILFYVARNAGGEVIAGAVIFKVNSVLHLQYAAANDEGKETYAVDVIYHDLIFNRFPQMRWFDFGISNERAGLYLNSGMVRHKEEFGGRSVCYDAYALKCGEIVNLS